MLTGWLDWLSIFIPYTEGRKELKSKISTKVEGDVQAASAETDGGRSSEETLAHEEPEANRLLSWEFIFYYLVS